MQSAVYAQHVNQAALLARIWVTRTFWRYNIIHAIPVAFGVLFWWRVIVGVLHGGAPLLGWMISAYISIWISVLLNWRILTGIQEAAQRQRLAMLFLQFTVIIVANTVVIGLMLAFGIYFRQADLFILGSAATGLAAIGWGVLSGRLRPDSDWALCWYSVSLKSAPQVVQAAALFTGFMHLDVWSVLFLLAQGTSRWWISREVKLQDPENSKKRAQLTSASWDVATVLLIALGVVCGALW